MALQSLSLLDGYRSSPLPKGYPASIRTLYAPVDDVHGALKALIESATKTLDVAMYAFTDQELADALAGRILAGVDVRISLDQSQYNLGTEKSVITAENFSHLAIGNSEKGAIMHLKMMVIDGFDVVSGSTNFSHSGQSLQDNVLTVIRQKTLATEATARLDAIYNHMVVQPGPTPAKKVWWKLWG